MYVCGSSRHMKDSKHYVFTRRADGEGADGVAGVVGGGG